jgi:hypothetical protein
VTRLMVACAFVIVGRISPPAFIASEYRHYVRKRTEDLKRKDNNIFIIRRVFLPKGLVAGEALGSCSCPRFFSSLNAAKPLLPHKGGEIRSQLTSK